MTSAMPSGDGTVDSAGPESALDEDAAPDTGLEPDTAGDDVAGADVPPTSDPDVRAAESPDATGADDSEDADRDSRSTITETHAAPPSDVTELDGPALENDEMREGTADLQSSERKSAEAQEIVDDLTAKSQPSAPDTVMPG